jgi:hypothetical protein
MGLQELYKKIESDFHQETLLEFNIILNDASNNLSPEERGIFLDWLEYEFLYNQLTFYDTQHSSLASVKKHLSSDAVQEVESVINKQKKYTEYLQKWIIENKSNNLKVEEPEVDLSDTTATEKIIYLHELGIINFLRTKQPFSTSINSLATVLSAITGVKPETRHIQSMLNPMFSKEAGQKNNPLNSKTTVAKVQKQLNDIGFNLNKTI